MYPAEKGFSLLEVLIATAIMLLIGTSVFHLFRQNEKVFHDRDLVTEMQQGARAAVSLAAGEIRTAGQGLPVYATTYDAAPGEAAVAILAGSNAMRINFRAGIAPAESAVTSPGPLTLTSSVSSSVVLSNATAFSDAVGNSPAGRFVYIWGDLGTSRWGWVRASITSITPSTKVMKIIPTDTGSSGPAKFPTAPTIALEEAIAIYRDSSGTMKHTTASNMTNPANAVWSPANDLLTNVTQLTFSYFDRYGNTVTPDTLVHRACITRVDVRVDVQTTQELSNHTRPTYSVSLRSSIRNAF